MNNKMNLANPVDSPWWRVKMKFYLDIQPVVTWDQFRKQPKVLYRDMARWVNRAEEYEKELRESLENLGEGQIEELVTSFLYPMDEEPMKGRLNPDQLQGLMEWFENPPERRIPEESEDPDLIDMAVKVAEKAHKGQTRKGTDTPYVIHPLAVGTILTIADRPEYVIAAGILHDVVEDSSFTLADIQKRFGHKVAAIVKGCSEPDKSLPWEERKGHTLDFLKKASPEIKFVALADKFQNISSIAEDIADTGDTVWGRFKRGKEDQKWYYEGLVDTLRDRSIGEEYMNLHEEFSKKVGAVFGSKNE
jgi:hypothetical protein